MMVLVFVAQSCSQEKTISKKYQTENYEFDYPATWLISNENNIVNVYSRENFGAVTFSNYSGIDFPLEETKNFILELNQLQDEPRNVKMDKKEDGAEFTHNYFDKVKKIYWFTKVIRKNTDFYLMTINCSEKYWESEKLKFFGIVDSFKIKK